VHQHYLNDSARLGWAMREAVEKHYDGTVAFRPAARCRTALRRTAWRQNSPSRSGAPSSSGWTPTWCKCGSGEWADFCAMLPEYAAKGHGEGFMHDTAMLLGALGWSAYDGQAEVVTPYFAASGTGQINAVFPVTHRTVKPCRCPKPRAPRSYKAFPRL
jgi:3,4-dihydroxyphenylacetate 2,3-dioxygenase